MLFIKPDLFFFYRNVCRFLLIQQWAFIYNTNQLPILKRLKLTFKIFNLTDLDDVRAYNYAYLFRFFFGKKATFSKYVLRFHLGVNYFTFSVNCFFNKQEAYFPLSVFVNDILFFSSDQFFFSSLVLMVMFFLFGLLI